MVLASDHAKSLALSLRDNAIGADAKDEHKDIVSSVYSALNDLNQSLFQRWLGLYNAGKYEDADQINNQRGYIAALQIDLERHLISLLNDGLEEATQKIGDINKQLAAVTKSTEQGAKSDKQIAGVLDQLAKLIGWVKEA